MWVSNCHKLSYRFQIETQVWWKLPWLYLTFPKKWAIYNWNNHTQLFCCSYTSTETYNTRSLEVLIIYLASISWSFYYLLCPDTFTIVYRAVISMAEIGPGRIGTDVRSRLVNRSENPNNYFCGWYVHYSSVCVHAFREVPVHCGAKTTRSGKSGFCYSPAPKNIVGAVRINVKCQFCWYPIYQWVVYYSAYRIHIEPIILGSIPLSKTRQSDCKGIFWWCYWRDSGRTSREPVQVAKWYEACRESEHWMVLPFCMGKPRARVT